MEKTKEQVIAEYVAEREMISELTKHRRQLLIRIETLKYQEKLYPMKKFMFRTYATNYQFAVKNINHRLKKLNKGIGYTEKHRSEIISEYKESLNKKDNG